jgi:hypothetical protein
MRVPFLLQGGELQRFFETSTRPSGLEERSKGGTHIGRIKWRLGRWSAMPTLGYGEDSARGFKDLTSDIARLSRGEPTGHHSDPTWIQDLRSIIAEGKILRHSGIGHRSDGVCRHPITRQLHGGNLSKRGDASFGCSIIRLADISIKT